MKRLAALLLALVLSLGLIPNTLAAEAVTPTPPPWCPEEEYAVFPGSAAYEPENWAILTQARSEVTEEEIGLNTLSQMWKFIGLPDRDKETGEQDFGILFEKALIQVRLLYGHDHYSGTYWTTLSTILENGGDEKLNGLTDQQRYVVLLWTARGILRYNGVGEKLNGYLPYLLKYPQFSMEKLVRCDIFSEKDQERYLASLNRSWEDYNSHVEIFLDGRALDMDVPPEIRNQRTMVPIRAVAEAIGADVEWVQDTQQIVMTRAGSTVTMTLNSTTADIDGRAVEMDVAPYATAGRTLIPARYVAEFFDQKVDWDGTKRQVLITEDKSALGDSNLEEWGIGMALVYGIMNVSTEYGRPPLGRAAWFGMYYRHPNEVTVARNGLTSSWGVAGHDSLVSLVQRMTPHGHNDSFREDADFVNSLTPKEFTQLLALSDEVGKYMWPYTKEIDGRWGGKGILAWDLSRMAHVVQQGYTAGYLTYEEALELTEPIARSAAETFDGWEEFYLNYLDGYNWWARNDVIGMRTEYENKLVLENGKLPETYQYWWSMPRADYYRILQKRLGSTLDDTLFTTGVIPLPDKEG